MQETEGVELVILLREGRDKRISKTLAVEWE